MNDDDLAAIRARAEAATDDAWKVATSDDGWGVYVDDYPGKVYIIADRLNRSDAEFIAHAREDVPWLLDEIERLRADVQSYRNLAEDYAEEIEAVHAERDVRRARHRQALVFGRRQVTALDRVRELVDEANEWRPVESRDEGECFPAVIVDDLIAGLRAAIEGTDS